jgi:hypothetical protein
MQKTDPMAPHDYFDLEGKMGGSGLMAGGAGGGKLWWNRLMGKKGFELKNPKFQKGQNQPATINGQNYSGHALDQMQNRGITPSVVEETLKNGTQLATRGNAYHIYDPKNNISVIINNETKNIITVRVGK